MPAQSTRTLTQRRTTVTPASVVNESISTPPPMTPTTNLTSPDMPSSTEGGNSILKIAIWGVVILLIAGIVYLLINNVLTRNNTVTPIVTPTPTEEPREAEAPEVINASKLDSSLAEDAPEDSDFKTSDQTLGVESEDEFSIQSFVTRSYDRFFRLEFEVSSSGDSDFPLVTAKYNAAGNSIDLEFDGVVEDNSGLEFEVPQEVEGSVVTSIIRRATSDVDVAKYTIGISEDVGYFLHSLDEPNRVVVDIKEPAVTATPTPTPTGTDDTDTREKPAAPHLTNEFSKDKQYIVTTLTTNTVTTPKYAFRDFGNYLKITYDLSGGIPNVEAEIEGNDLIITMSNRISSNKTATIDINNGSVTTVDVVSSGNTTTYTVHMSKPLDYRIYATESPAQFIIEVRD